ncbi:hypothetical protein SAMN05660284_02651 [Formivibrio citricus]|uniref:Uncharacterized protein n=2 Tax=Formivibrio citricus TaxID=83765 RepID=A0A1I5DG67_9NEIS|nr:hypothetical protein SAMN05660284_02651 [Formivibrio citricus]
MNRTKYFSVVMAAIVVSLFLDRPSLASETLPEWVKMIECKVAFEDYMSFVLGDFQDEKLKAKMGIKKIQQDNPFLHEYELSQPIKVYGHETRRVVFNSAGIMAVLDEKAPLPLAEKLGLNVVVNTGTKILATRTISETKPETIGSMKVWRKISQDLSTVSSHRDKTLLGCTYKLMEK